MILNNNIQFVSFNPSTKKFNYEYQRVDNIGAGNLPVILKSRNVDSNIYTILNDFNKERTIKDIVGFNTIGIDLDYKSDMIVEELLEQCESLLGFLPSKINKTFKGYHVFFNLEDDLYNLTVESYEKAYNKINTLLDGDKAMKSVTGILKAEGFYDRKDGRDFLIETIYDTGNTITEANLNGLLGDKVSYDLKRAEKYNMKSLKKSRNNYLTDLISAEGLIAAVNEFYNTDIKIVNSSIDNTSGLKVHEGKIKDHSGKGRYGIYGFLFNYVEKELGVDVKSKLPIFFNKHFGIKFNKNLNAEPIVNTQFNLNLTKNTFGLNKEQLLNAEVVEAYNNMLIKGKQKGEVTKAAMALNKYELDNRINLNNEADIKEKDLLDIMGLSMSKQNRVNLRSNILLLSNLTIITKVERNGRTFDNFLRLFDLMISTDVNQPTLYRIKSNLKSSKKSWVDPRTFSEFKKPELFNLAVKIQTTVSDFGSANLNMSEVCEETNSKEQNVKKVLKKLKELKMIKEVKYTKNTIYIK